MSAIKASAGSPAQSPGDSPLTPEQRTGRLLAAIGEITPERAQKIVALLAQSTDRSNQTAA